MTYIIDTDPGLDDAMALMFAVKAGLDIGAITTVAGNATVENTTRNARHILAILGRGDIPLYSGSAKPLKRDLVLGMVHGASGLDGMSPENSACLTGNAVQKIIETVRRNQEVTIIALAPLTNIAQAIQKDSKTMSKIKEIVIMGGAIRVPGNKNRVAEFNMFVDPDAADIVFHFPVRKTLVPLDACNKIKMRLSDFQKVKGTLREPLVRMAKPYIKHIYREEGVRAAIMYDPLTIYYALKPRVCRVRQYDICVETKGEHTRGMTVADLRRKSMNVNMTNVVENISEKAFKNDFIHFLSRE